MPPPENRRESFRHLFAAEDDRPTVELRSTQALAASPLVGRLHTVAMGGLSVWFDREVPPPSVGAVWSVQFALPGPAGQPIRVRQECALAYAEARSDGALCGFRCVGVGARGNLEYRHALWDFLLTQRQASGGVQPSRVAAE